jgi:hypothetical protein
MTYLSFNVPMHRLHELDVPLEIRDENMRLVAETLASRGVSVDPGRYIVTALMPAGQRVTKIVDTNESQEITLDLPTGQQSPHEWREIGHYFASARARRAVRMASDAVIGLESFTPMAPVTAAMRMFSGNLLTRQMKTIPVDAVREDFMPEVAHLSCGPATELRYVQIVQPGRPAVNIALPISHLGCTIAIHREPERYWIEVHPNDEQANLLLGYTQNHMLAQQTSVAEGLLYRKQNDPIAAAVGAYSLLRIGDLERLHHWTQNLAMWFEWLPDGAAIRGEHLARLGDHAGALASFLGVPKRGLPMFSDGIRFTHDRLRTYAATDGETEEMRNALKALRTYVSYVDFDKAVTTFPGVDPLKPGDEIVDELPAKNLMEIAPLFV